MAIGMNALVFRLASLIVLPSLLSSCAAEERLPSWALAGNAAVGKIIKVQPVTMWTGDVPMNGNIFVMQPDGDPDTPPFSFASASNCPAPIVGEDRYWVMVRYVKFGFSYDSGNADNLPIPPLTAMSCAKLDPSTSIVRM